MDLYVMLYGFICYVMWLCNQTITVLMSQRNLFVFDFISQIFQPGPFIQGTTPSLLVVS